MSVVEFPKILTKGYYTSLENTPIQNDKLRFTLDTMQLFLDANNERREISDFIKNLTEEEIRATFAPLPKFYYAKDTKRFLYNTGEEWIVVAEANPDIAPLAQRAFEADHATTADSATTATNADHADEADHATNADSATNATNATNADHADESYHATNATNATSANHATTADSATTATNATNATNADHADESDHATTATNATNATNADHATTADSATSATKATKDANDKQINITYAPIASPVFTGTPSVPTAADNSNNNQIANTAYVKKMLDAVYEAIGAITGFSQVVVSSIDQLPETGVAGTFYYVPAENTEEDNIYDEYLWFGNNYEKIGSSKIDLSNYLNSFELTGTGNAITGVSKSGQKISFTKGATFLTAHPSVTHTSTTGTESPNSGASFEVVDSVATDDFGHLTNFRKKTVTMPTSVSGNAGTATKWSTGRNINGMSVQGDANRVNYGSCSTEADTAAKTVACDGFGLITGSEITVKFTVTNTAANPTLNVNNTGAKPIFYRGSAISAGYLAANRTYTFRYNGTQYELVGDIDTNTTYSAATASPKANGTAAVGSSAKYAREDHVHPAQTSVSGNAGTASGPQNDSDWDFGDLDA